MKNKIKFKKNYDSGAIHIFLNNTEYKPYLIGNLPPTFGQKEYFNLDDEGEIVITNGKYQWFNYKGLTYLKV